LGLLYVALAAIICVYKRESQSDADRRGDTDGQRADTGVRLPHVQEC
jgi:hypothetical protein